MKTNIKPLVLAAVLATSTLGVLAQPFGGPGPGPDQDRRGPSAERMHERMAHRIDAFKTKLKLTPQQEGAWKNYLDAMKPAPRPEGRDGQERREDFAKLSTPERLDKLREFRKQREAEIDKRDAATRSFYAELSAEQKKTFDEHTGHFFFMQDGPGPRR